MRSRRHFLKTAATGAAWLAAPDIVISSLSAQTTESRVEVLLDEPIGTIAPEIYGHFVEHLGGVVYDGIWVGERSKIPNLGGLRKQLVDALARIKPGVIRWPGGCFADQYDWRDGIGPREKRPKRTNFWLDAREWSKTARRDGPACYDPNEFGTIEFARFSKLTGAQPYFAANVRSLPALEFSRWVEYCNAPAGATTLAEQRAADGEREPLKVRFWGVGNESWGCGGEMTPEEYATEFRRWTSWAPRFGVALAYIASGPNGASMDWTRGFFRKLTEKGKGQLRNVYGWALHYYCGTTGKGALDFSVDDWYELLNKADRMESLITDHWAAMGEIDTERRVKLIVDEWGAWHPAGTEIDPTHLFGQVSTMRDALVAALTLDTFNRHADKLAMANIAQLINCLQSLFLARGDQFVLTPNYHVFEMYAGHQAATAVRTQVAAPRIGYSDRKSLWGLAGSASLEGKALVLTLVNPHVTEERLAEIVVRGARISGGSTITLSAPDIHAHNSFTEPEAVKTESSRLSFGEGNPSSFLCQLKPASVTKLSLTLA
ncbi:MAG: alpha-L-arabinofuranosidase C-terminal domain-containing protein [Bryobacteraceae bacterium]